MPVRTLLFAGATAIGLAAPMLAAAQGPAYTVDELNLRAGPGTGYPPIITMPRGAEVFVHGCDPDVSWCELTFGGITGWASADYLDAISPVHGDERRHAKKRQGRHAKERHEVGTTAAIPPGHLPPPGECRTWYPDLPPGHQPPPHRC